MSSNVIRIGDVELAVGLVEVVRPDLDRAKIKVQSLAAVEHLVGGLVRLFVQAICKEVEKHLLSSLGVVANLGAGVLSPGVFFGLLWVVLACFVLAWLNSA